MELKGTGVSPGLAWGRIYRPEKPDPAQPKTYEPGTADEERARLRAAAGQLAARLNEAAEARRQQGETEAADILEVHALMADDPALFQSADVEITAGRDAITAVLAAAEEQAAALEKLEDDYLRERATDIRDIGRSLARELTGAAEALPKGALLVTGQELSPELLGELPTSQLAGVLLGGGSATVHAAILARARGIPAIVGLGESLADLREGSQALMDGTTGTVNSAPTPADIAAAQAAAAAARQEAEKLRTEIRRGAVTRDGKKIRLLGNAAGADEVQNAVEQGAEGIGLLRSEFLFFGRDTLPDEEEQYQAYRAAVQAAQGKRCVIRTLDVGGDKPLKALPLPAETNPFLGQRAIRVSLARPDLLRTQLKAILRAGADGPAAVMLPMVTNPEEIEAVRGHLTACCDELSRAGLPFDAALPLGIMIETPAAALLAESLGKHCDFFSVGTNDLTQYTLAADRSNPAMAALGDYLHPAVLRLIALTVQGGDVSAIPVSVCGEMAADPLAAPLLLALGASGLSMAPASFSRVRQAIGRVTLPEAAELLTAAMSMDTAAAVRNFLQEKMAEKDA